MLYVGSAWQLRGKGLNENMCILLNVSGVGNMARALEMFWYVVAHAGKEYRCSNGSYEKQRYACNGSSTRAK